MTPDAVTVWLRGDLIHMHIAGHQTLTFPTQEFGRFLNVLRCREQAQTLPRLGEPGHPVQYDIDQIAAAMQTQKVNITGAAIRERDEKRQRGLIRRADKAREQREAVKLCEELGL